jgi:hypothetical protein
MKVQTSVKAGGSRFNPDEVLVSVAARKGK